MRRPFAFALTLAAAFALAGCEESLDPDAALNASIQISAGHIHALETDVTYTVQVTADEQDGLHVANDFETIAIEQNLAGTSTWRRLPLTVQTNGSYTGTHRFINPGTYNTRLVGKRAGQAAEATIKELATQLAAVRSHFDAGGYRVEFDITPGFPDELAPGKAYTMQFYIMQPTADLSGNRAPITGLTGVTVRCTEVNGTFQDHAATEVSPGLYTASHTFGAKGTVMARVSFSGTSGAAAVDMPLPLQ